MNVEGPMLLVPTHVVPETNITVFTIDNATQQYHITDGKDENTCQASYAGLRINIGVLMSFTTSRGKKHWHTVKGWR
jgi:hypothetical protein